MGSSPEGDEDSCAFSTSRISKRDDPRVDPPSPVVPINTQKALPPPQREMVPYSLPVRPHRQLTKRDLGSFDFKLLNSIEAVVNSAPYLRDVGHRNGLVLDKELRTSNALTTFFRGGGVVELPLTPRRCVDGGVQYRVLQCHPHGMKQLHASDRR
jgi:hypothetical protein